MKTKCSKCEQEKEKGKEIFWCPRLRNYEEHALTFYGNWTCLNCCKESFYKAIHDKHLSRSWSGSCAECDFPIGAILDAKESCGIPTTEFHVAKICENHIILHNTLSFLDSSLDYYGFKWDKHRKTLRVVRKPYIRAGVHELVLVKKKLPTRIVIILEETLTYEPLLWSDLNRYYWSSCGYKQHSRRERWMDIAPVIICSGYLNENGVNLDKEFKKKIEYIKTKIREVSEEENV